MENATDALKLAFAVLVFVMALSLCIATFSQARIASEFILYVSDETNYFDYTYGEGEIQRIVGLETIIPTLYRYYKESYTVIFRDENGREMELYKTSDPDWLSEENKKLLQADNRPTDGWIGRFDIAEEVQRGEMWTGNPDKDCKLHLDAIIYGKRLNNPNGNPYSYVSYSTGLVQKFGNAKFYETLGEYEYERLEDGSVGGTNTSIEVDGEIVDLVKKDVKRVITYTLIK